MSLTTDQARVTNAREGIIIAALRSGNLHRAIELLFETYQDDLYAYCARRVGTSEAVTVYHRVLAAAIDDLSVRDATTSLRAWLFGIARKTIDAQRRRRRATAQHPVSASELEQVMAELQPRAREVLQLTLWHGLTLAEVARITNLSVGQARAIAGDALAQISMHFAQPDGRPS